MSIDETTSSSVPGKRSTYVSNDRSSESQKLVGGNREGGNISAPAP